MMRKCLLMPVPPEVVALAPPFTPLLAPPPRRVAPEVVPVPVKRRDRRRDVRVLQAFPAFPAGGLGEPTTNAHALGAFEAMRPARVVHADAIVAEGRARAKAAQGAWWEDPIALGSLLILAPPVGLAAVWGSTRYSRDARWALTVMTALTMLLTTAIALTVFVHRSR